MNANEATRTIDANVSDYFAGRISHEEFTVRQVATWATVQASRPVERKVLRTLRRRHAAK